MEIYIDAKLNYHERLEKCKMILFIKYSFHPSVHHTFIIDLREDLGDQREDLGDQRDDLGDGRKDIGD